MIRSFADDTTRDVFGNVNSKAARRIPNTAWKAAQRKLKQIDLVTKLDDLKIPPGNRSPRCLRSVTADTAIRLEPRFRMPARFWLHLQADYDLQTALNEAKATKRRMKGPA